MQTKLILTDRGRITYLFIWGFLPIFYPFCFLKDSEVNLNTPLGRLNHKAKNRSWQEHIRASLVLYSQSQSSLQGLRSTPRRWWEAGVSIKAEKGDPWLGRAWRSAALCCLAVPGGLAGPQRRMYNGTQGLLALPEHSRSYPGGEVAKSWDSPEGLESGAVGACWQCERWRASLPRSYMSSSLWFYPRMGIWGLADFKCPDF